MVDPAESFFLISKNIFGESIIKKISILNFKRMRVSGVVTILENPVDAEDLV